ncbi:MAG TPA: hypothetical protein VFC58_02580 [Desulfosporosinus sp.]|nr:hypothetical protein [Desulfosporosinus sp.]
MNDLSSNPNNDQSLLYFTIPIVILMVTCSSIGIWVQQFYSKETVDWLSQCIGQDISNLIFVSPILIASAKYASKGHKTAKIIWIGTMITNIYSYVIYTFALHFNVLFLVYCLILGLSIFSVLNFLMNNINEDFKSWFSEKAPTKIVGILLFVIACMFTLLWLSDILPAVLTNTVPANITKDNLLINPVQALDFSFYLPLMFISSVMLIKKKVLGYLMAPMMLVFAIVTNVNIICLMVVSMQKTLSNNSPIIIAFCVFAMVCCAFLGLFLKYILKST